MLTAMSVPIDTGMHIAYEPQLCRYSELTMTFSASRARLVKSLKRLAEMQKNRRSKILFGNKCDIMYT